MVNIRARSLRKTMTEAEKRLWNMLRDRRLAGLKFRRQYPISYFIVDFACFELKLIIEADGGQHNENAADDKRTLALNAEGWRVVRFWNNDVLRNLEGVRTKILEAAGIEART